jgi:predicted dehydrogenase
MTTVRWGILSTGAMARLFAEGLARLERAELVAVGSRTREAAIRFGEAYGVPRRHASYRALVEDPEVDVVYVATPHAFHHRDTLMSLAAGKAVLCEKAFALNAPQAREMVAEARRRKLFLMEAMWNRFNPVVKRMHGLVEDGAIGEPRMLVADFGLGASFDPANRLFDPALGGGALLDLGVYPVALASLLFGPPASLATQAHLGLTGVDERAGMVFRYQDEKLAVLHTSLREKTPSEATLFGTEGKIHLQGPIFRPTALRLTRPAEEDELFQPVMEGNGYDLEAAEVMRCLAAGKTESSAMTLDETISIMETLDALRAAWGMRYPGE